MFNETDIFYNINNNNNIIVKSAQIIFSLSKYQNIKLHSGYAINILNLSEDKIKEINKKIWIDRGKDLKLGIKICLRKFAGLEKPIINDKILKKSKEINEANETNETNDNVRCADLSTAYLIKNCEISAEILKTNDQYQNSKFYSGKTWTITYSSEEEREKFEQEKWLDIAEDINNGIKNFFESIGKKTDIQKKIAKLCIQKLIAIKSITEDELKFLNENVDKNNNE